VIGGHVTPAARGGPTSAVNGLGGCAACTYATEAPGWRVHTWCDTDGMHTAEFTAPSGSRHRYSATCSGGTTRRDSGPVAQLVDGMAVP
jgi:hypothetical protein